MRRPALSVVVALQKARHTVTACVDSLLAQTGLAVGMLEIILVDGSQDGTAEWVAERYPDLLLLRPPGTRSLPALLGVGVARAQGALVAISEGHCTFAPEWAATAIAAHSATESPVIGGAVEPGASLQALDWALYFCDYGQFLLPLARLPTYDLPGNNAIFKRAVLDRGIDFGETGFWKTFFCQQLEAEGHTLFAEPRLIVYYHRRLSPRQILRRRYLHGRCFGAMRAGSAGVVWRGLYALAGPLLPSLLMLKLIHRVWPKDRYRRRFLLVLPWSCLILLVWSVGEYVGNLFGASQSCSSL